MGPSKPKNLSYRDDPDAVSLHTTPDDVQYADDVADLPGNVSSSPPTYNETTYYTDTAHGKFESAGLNVRDCHFSNISTTQSVFRKTPKTRITGEHVRIQNQFADTHPEYLQEWIEYMSRQAPSPYIVIVGTHSEQQRDTDGKKKRVDVTDFRICISLRNYLWPNFRANDPTMMELCTVDNGEKTWRGTVFKKRAPGAKGDIEVGEAKPTLQEWCHRYCASSSNTRIFRLTRTVTGLNEEYVRNRLTGIIRGTNYKGHLDISFPVADRAVDIYSKSLLNDWRLNTWICWAFYLTFLWIFSWPILYFTTKRYHVVRAEWPFSQADAHGNHRYTTVSEEQWVEKFGPAVKQLAWDRYEGVAGDDMLNQVLARPETHRPLPAEFRAASAGVGAAVGAFRAGTNTVSQLNNILRFAGGSNDEVGWGYDT